MTVVESRIDAVTVYHSGAAISRAIDLELGDGVPAEIEIQRLPLALFDPSVKVRVEQLEPAAASLDATDVRVGLHALPRDDGGDEPDRERLKQVERELLITSQRMQHVTLEGNYLRCLELPSRPQGEDGKPPPASPVAARVALEQFADDAIGKRTAEMRELRPVLERLQEEAAELRDRLQRASTAREAKPGELRKTVIARLSCRGEPPRKVRLSLEYLVPGARWAPAYRCRLSRDCRQAELQQRALICQRSGEDWSGVRLTLSTAAPLSWSELPELSSIRIGRAQPTPPAKRGFRQPPRGAGALFEDYDRDRSRTAALVPQPAAWQPPAFGASPPELVPEIESGADFVADDTPTNVPLSAELAEQAAVLDDFDEAMVAVAEPYEAENIAPSSLAPASLARAAMAPPAPAAPAPPARAAKQAKAKPRRGRSTSTFGRHAGLAAQDGEAIAALVFSQLRLGEPQTGSRGQLLPVDTRSAYLELLERQSVDVHVDVMNVVHQRQEQAAQLANMVLPEGAADVRRCAGNFDYAYQADALVDVESDGAWHSVALGTREAASDVRYIVVPREDTNVFRVATLTNPLAAPLLPGPAEVHVGGEYVVTTPLPLVAADGEFRLGLGVEQAIKVARNTRYRESRSGAKVVAMTELEHAVEIELVNNLERQIQCEVRERIPQPEDGAEVVVEEVSVEPPWERYDQRERHVELRGGRRWEVTVEPGARQPLRAVYTVKIYANNELVGGNRREA